MNFKKAIFISVIIITVCITILMVAYISNQPLDSQFKERKLPDIQLTTTKCTPHLINIEGNKVLIFFKPDCPYCVQFAENIINSEFGFEGIEILFISSEHPDNILQFSLNHYSEKITYLCDETNLFSKELRVKKYPTIFIYSGESQKITKRFVGAVPFVQIRQEFSNE